MFGPTPEAVLQDIKKNRLTTKRSLYELIDNSVEAIGNRQDNKGSIYVDIEYKKDKISKIFVLDTGTSVKDDKIISAFQHNTTDSCRKKNVKNNIGYNGIGFKEAIVSLGNKTSILLKPNSEEPPSVWIHSLKKKRWEDVFKKITPTNKKFKELENHFNNIAEGSTGTLFCIEDIDNDINNEVMNELSGKVDIWGSLVVRYTKRLKDNGTSISFFLNKQRLSLKHPIEDYGLKSINTNTSTYKQKGKGSEKTVSASFTTTMYKCEQEEYTKLTQGGVWEMNDGVRKSMGFMVFVSGVLVDNSWKSRQAVAKGLLKRPNQRYNHYFPVIELDNYGNMSLPIDNNKELKTNASFKNVPLGNAVEKFFKTEWKKIVKETNSPTERQSSETNDFLRMFRKKHIDKTGLRGSNRVSKKNSKLKEKNTSKKTEANRQQSLPFEKSDGRGRRPKPEFIVDHTLTGPRACQISEEDNKIILQININSDFMKKKFGINEENLNPEYEKCEDWLLILHNQSLLDYRRSDTYDEIWHKTLMEGKTPYISDSESLKEVVRIEEVNKNYTLLRGKESKTNTATSRRRTLPYADILNEMIQSGYIERNTKHTAREIAEKIYDRHPTSFKHKNGGCKQIAAEIGSQFGSGFFDEKINTKFKYFKEDKRRYVEFL